MLDVAMTAQKEVPLEFPVLNLEGKDVCKHILDEEVRSTRWYHENQSTTKQSEMQAVHT